MKKKTMLCCLLALALLLGPAALCVPASAEGAPVISGVTLREGGLVTFDGAELPTPALWRGEKAYIRLSEAVDALGLSLEHEAGAEEFSFAWRKSRVSLRAGSTELVYRDEVRELDAETLLCDGASDLLVPLEAFCAGAEIGVLYDEEFDHYYCTPGAGLWPIPEGYNVPVMMYHGVGNGSEEANLFVDPGRMEEQIVYLLDHGFTPIWFEDLEHVEDYEKPILLTFDDGWRNNHTYLLPLLEKYHVKATVFVVWEFFERSHNHLSSEQALEMYESGWVSFQSHTLSHEDLSLLSAERQEIEMRDSRLFLTRMFGKEPFVLSYPIGGTTHKTLELCSEYYRFGVKMVSGKCYNTSDDPLLVYRFFPQKQTTMREYIHWLDKSFPPEEQAG